MPAFNSPNLPANKLTEDPTSVLQQQFQQTYDYLAQQYSQEAKNLESTPMMDDEFQSAVNELNSKYTMMLNDHRFKADQQLKQLSTIDEMIQAGRIDPSAGQEAKWRMIVPRETAQAMFPTQAKPEAFSIGHLATDAVYNTIQDFIGSAEDRSRRSLLQQYVRWRDYAAYDALSPIQQRQYDQLWDAAMAGSKKYKDWFADEGRTALATEVQAIRSPGKLGQAMAKKITSPLAQSIRPKMSPFAKAALMIPAVSLYTMSKIGDARQRLAAKQQGGIEKTLTKQDHLREYRRLGGSKTTEGRAYADRFLIGKE